MIWNTRKIRSGFRQGLQIFLWYDPKLGWYLEDFRGFVRSPDRTFGVFEIRSGDRTAFLGLLKFCPNFGQDFLLFTTPVPLKKIVHKLIEIVCKLFFLVIFVPNKQDIMKRLTAREEEIMGFVRQTTAWVLRWAEAAFQHPFHDRTRIGGERFSGTSYVWQYLPILCCGDRSRL